MQCGVYCTPRFKNELKHMRKKGIKINICVAFSYKNIALIAIYKIIRMGKMRKREDIKIYFRVQLEYDIFIDVYR